MPCEYGCPGIAGACFTNFLHSIRGLRCGVFGFVGMVPEGLEDLASWQLGTPSQGYR